MSSKIIVGALCLSLLIPGGSAMAQTPSTTNSESATAPAPESVQDRKPAPLTPEEAKSLAERNEEPPREVAGGSLNNQQLTYIVIALAAAVLVLVLK